LYYYQYIAEHLLLSKALVAAEQKYTCTVYLQLSRRLWHSGPVNIPINLSNISLFWYTVRTVIPVHWGMLKTALCCDKQST